MQWRLGQMEEKVKLLQHCIITLFWRGVVTPDRLTMKWARLIFTPPHASLSSLPKVFASITKSVQLMWCNQIVLRLCIWKVSKVPSLNLKFSHPPPFSLQLSSTASNSHYISYTVCVQVKKRKKHGYLVKGGSRSARSSKPTDWPRSFL